MIDRIFRQVEERVSRVGGGEPEVHVQRTRVRRFDARNGRIDSISFSDSLAVGLRVFREGRMGFSYAFRDDEEEIGRMVEAALFCAEASAPDDAHGLPEEGGEYPSRPLYDPECEGTGDAEKATFASEIERQALAADPRVKRVRSATLSETIAHVAFRNARGRSGEQRFSFYSGWVDAVAEEGSEGQTGSGFGFARRLSGLSAPEIGREGGERAIRMLGAQRLRSGRYAAVLENGAAAELLEVLVPSFLMSQVAKGKSMLAGKIGEAVASPKVTVTDDPLDPAGAGAAVFDGEGVPSRETVLLSGGVLRGYLADTFWARRTGTKGTASCRRPGPKSPPAVGISSLRILPGERGLDALCRDLGDGILLTEFLGIHTADPVSGDFSVGAAGFRIEGGAVAAPLRGFAVSGNILRLLAGVAEVGSDFRWFGNVGAPSLAVEAIDAGGE